VSEIVRDNEQPPGGNHRPLDLPSARRIPTLTAYLFDRERGTKVENWKEAFLALNEDEMLWVDLIAPSEEEWREAREVFQLREGLNTPAA